MVNYYNAEGSYYALYCSLESVQVFTDPKEGIPEILNNLKFSISYSSLPLKDVFAKDIEGLYAQHTKATGQVFEPTAIEKVFEQTDGQPWLVNAIAREIIQNILDNDYSKTITIEKALIKIKIKIRVFFYQCLHQGLLLSE